MNSKLKKSLPAVKFVFDYIAELEAENENLKKVKTLKPEWLPIETAPKDGSHILVCRWPLNHSIDLGVFCHNVAWWGKENDGDGAWVIYNDQIAEAYCFFEPTHWMPIPEPPTGPSGTGVEE